MSDLNLDTTTHDLVLNKGDLSLVNKDASIRQHLKQRILFFRGEWFLDTGKGVPYYQFILVKNPNLDLVEATLRDVVTSTPGILELSEFDVNYTPGNRELSIGLQAKSIEGDVTLTAGV